MYSVYVYDAFDTGFCVEVLRTDSQEVANFKSNLLEALGLITCIGYEEN